MGRARLIPLVLALGCAPAPPEPGDAALVATFEELHRPLYGVYALNAEDRDGIWDLLAASYAGRTLTRQYVEHFTTLQRMRAEQTAIDVRRIDYADVHVTEYRPDAARLEATWSVGGVVTHAAHRHPRVNRYQAVYELARGTSGWRIVGARSRNVERVKTPPPTDSPFDLPPEAGDGMLDPLDLLDAGLLEETAP